MVEHPDNDDVVVRQGRGNPSVIFLFGTPSSPDQLSLQSRDEAVDQAVGFARHQRVRAWFAHGDGTFVLLATFRTEI